MPRGLTIAAIPLFAERSKYLPLSTALKILPLICYEIIYSGKLFKSSNFDLIINISEDGRFGKSIGP